MPVVSGASAPTARTRGAGGDGEHCARQPEPLEQRDDCAQRRRGRRPPTASTWSVPYSGTSQNDVANVPAMLPAVEIANSRPAVRPSRSSDRAASRTAIGETEASTTLIGPKSDDRRDERVEPRAGIPGDDLLEHPLVDERDRQHERSAECDRADEQVRRRPPVGERAAGPVADRETGEDDADERAPDVEGAAERRGKHAARGDLDTEEGRAGEEDGGADREPVDPAPTLHRYRLDVVDAHPGAVASSRLTRPVANAGRRRFERPVEASPPAGTPTPPEHAVGDALRRRRATGLRPRAERAEVAPRVKAAARARKLEPEDIATVERQRGRVGGDPLVDVGTSRSIQAAASRRGSRPVSDRASAIDHQSGTTAATRRERPGSARRPASTANRNEGQDVPVEVRGYAGAARARTPRRTRAGSDRRGCVAGARWRHRRALRAPAGRSSPRDARRMRRVSEDRPRIRAIRPARAPGRGEVAPRGAGMHHHERARDDKGRAGERQCAGRRRRHSPRRRRRAARQASRRGTSRTLRGRPPPRPIRGDRRRAGERHGDAEREQHVRDRHARIGDVRGRDRDAECSDEPRATPVRGPTEPPCRRHAEDADQDRDDPRGAVGGLVEPDLASAREAGTGGSDSRTTPGRARRRARVPGARDEVRLVGVEERQRQARAASRRSGARPRVR